MPYWYLPFALPGWKAAFYFKILLKELALHESGQLSMLTLYGLVPVDIQGINSLGLEFVFEKSFMIEERLLERIRG